MSDYEDPFEEAGVGGSEILPRRELWRFLVLSFALGFLTQGAALGLGIAGKGRFLLGVTMWMPALAALLAGPESRRLVRAGLRRVAWRVWPLAFVVGIGQVVLLNLGAWVSGTGGWNGRNFPLDATHHGIRGVEGLAMVLGVGPQSFWFFALNLLVTLAVAAVIFGVVGGLGEELGWRGVLQPALESRFGPVKGTFLVGMIWAYWHLPANLAGYNDPVHPVLTSFVIFPVVVVGLAFAFGWLYRFSGNSVWPPAIAHASYNAVSSGFIITPNGWWSENLWGIVAALVLAVAFAKLLRRSNLGEARQLA